MKIHLRQIPDEGMHLEGEESADFLALPPEDHVRPLGPMQYSLDLGVSSDGVWATGELSLDLELQCVRCTEPFTYELQVPDVALQLERPSQETVDLTPELREDIILALPAYPHCDWSGERVCPGRLEAQGEEAASGVSSDAESLPPSAWETLDQLKMPSKQP